MIVTERQNLKKALERLEVEASSFGAQLTQRRSTLHLRSYDALRNALATAVDEAKTLLADAATVVSHIEVLERLGKIKEVPQRIEEELRSPNVRRHLDATITLKPLLEGSPARYVVTFDTPRMQGRTREYVKDFDTLERAEAFVWEAYEGDDALSRFQTRLRRPRGADGDLARKVTDLLRDYPREGGYKASEIKNAAHLHPDVDLSAMFGVRNQYDSHTEHGISNNGLSKNRCRWFYDPAKDERVNGKPPRIGAMRGASDLVLAYGL